MSKSRDGGSIDQPISVEKGQVSVRRALQFASPDPNTYVLQVPPSLCFGTVALGGFIMAFIHKAVVDFATRSSKSASHRHVQHMSVNFLRPTMPAPREIMAKFKAVSGNRAFTVLHFETSQNGKICVGGYATLTDLNARAALSVDTGWELAPSPTQTRVKSLEADNDANWVSYLTPFHPKDFRRPQSYMKIYVPIRRIARNTLDQWVTPGWKDDESPDDAVWTDELIHFVVDNVTPLLNDLVYEPTSERPSMHANIVKAGLAQRQARAHGKHDKIVGEGLKNVENLYAWSASTMFISTEIKKALPVEGTKWLFMRVTVKSLKNNKMDYDIVLLDEHGELVAVSQQVMLAIPVGRKQAKKAVL